MFPLSYRDEQVTIRHSSDLLNLEQREELEKAVWENFSIEEIHWETSKPGTGQIQIVDLDADVDRDTLQDFLAKFVRQ